jgi:hypothetical protein
MIDKGPLPNIPLSMEELAKIGATAVYEARAKAFVAVMLKPMESLNYTDWTNLERHQLTQLLDRVAKAAKEIDDETLTELVEKLTLCCKEAQNLRHLVVHAEWAHGQNSELTAFDNRRKKWLSTVDIEAALSANATLCGLAHRCAFQVVELVDAGRLPKRT